MIIKKRNGQPQPYCGDKIKQAVALAFASVEEPVDEHTLEEILQKVESRFPSASGGDYSLTVEEIQDMVELTLMEENLYKVLKSYILSWKLYYSKHRKNTLLRNIPFSS